MRIQTKNSSQQCRTEVGEKVHVTRVGDMIDHVWNYLYLQNKDDVTLFMELNFEVRLGRDTGRV